MNSFSPSPAPDEIVKSGEKIYFENKEKLEQDYFGSFAVIEIENKDIIVNEDKLVAIQEAREKYPDKIFYIVQIGNLKQQSSSELNELRRYGWSI